MRCDGEGLGDETELYTSLLAMLAIRKAIASKQQMLPHHAVRRTHPSPAQCEQKGRYYQHSCNELYTRSQT